MDIEQERKDRFRFLHRLWEVTGGDQYKSANVWAIGEELGFARAKSELVFQYLVAEGLAQSQAFGGTIGISHDGVREVEAALAEPERPTDYFPAVNLISIGTMSHSTIQQASAGAVQQVRYEQAAVEQFQEVIAEIKRNLSELQLNDEDRRQVEADVSTMEAQLASPKPGCTILIECLSSLRSILEKAAGAVVAAPILAKILPLLGLSSGT